MTGYILRTGNVIHDGPDLINTRHLIEAGEFEHVGAVSVDYVGVPLKTDGHTIGVLAVQTYVEGQIYTQDDVDLMVFVADHIATALARTRAAAEIRQRNAELAIVNEIGRPSASSSTSRPSSMPSVIESARFSTRTTCRSRSSTSRQRSSRSRTGSRTASATMESRQSSSARV